MTTVFDLVVPRPCHAYLERRDRNMTLLFSLHSGHPDIHPRGRPIDRRVPERAGTDGEQSRPAWALQTLESPEREEATEGPRGTLGSRAR